MTSSLFNFLNKKGCLEVTHLKSIPCLPIKLLRGLYGRFNRFIYFIDYQFSCHRIF
ncbi:hypothetical protein THEYE_A0890 [Thermodesulfovibrio yellowstonii DSM 11347]|uniref:Uncharacterized protein n=1 Tax=Thermodesulfovibrio yellowstonii (strain ATCC 51303 / DSM 11347 / YP87) TaxID=289376 RepID=B5YKG3_THEYD|nr:hypothetical protein THEYE_A0890 [Thermodesulfovibrio yellowstonii DSM 11347]